MKINHPIYASIAMALALSACTPEPAEQFASAEQAFAANDFRTARINLISALEAEPGNHEMRVLLAKAQIALGDGEGAASSLSKLPSELLNTPEMKVIAAEAEVLRGQFESALSVVEGLETAAADRVRALAHIGEGKLDDAAKAFEAGLARDEAYAPLLTTYARFEMVRGNLDEATKLVDRALELDGNSVEAYLVRGGIAMRRNELNDALAAYDKVLELHPGNFDGRLAKGDLLARLGRNSEAAQIAGDLNAEAPKDLKVAFLRARIASGEQEWGRVREILQRHETTLRDNPSMAVIYGEALLEVNQSAQALSWLEPVLRRQPGARKLRLLVARAQLANGNASGSLDAIRPLATRPDATPEELKLAANAAKKSGSAAASEFARRAQSPAPEWLGGEIAKADRALRNKQWRDAEEIYESIVSRTEGSNAMVLNNLSFAKTQLGKNDEALKLALQAVELEPDHPSILDSAGWLLVQSGSKERGLEMLRKAAKLAPDNANIARHLAQASAS